MSSTDVDNTNLDDVLDKLCFKLSHIAQKTLHSTCKSGLGMRSRAKTYLQILPSFVTWAGLIASLSISYAYRMRSKAAGYFVPSSLFLISIRCL